MPRGCGLEAREHNMLYTSMRLGLEKPRVPNMTLIILDTLFSCLPGDEIKRPCPSGYQDEMRCILLSRN